MKSTQSQISSKKGWRFVTSRSSYTTLLLSIVILIIWQIAEFTEKRSLQTLERTGSLRVNLYAGSLRDTLLNYRHHPYGQHQEHQQHLDSFHPKIIDFG